jgi:hypothetical protein
LACRNDQIGKGYINAIGKIVKILQKNGKMYQVRYLLVFPTPTD